MKWSLKLGKELEPQAAHGKLSEQVTDQAGRFPRGSGSDSITGDLSASGRLNLDAEQTRRLITKPERNTGKHREGGEPLNSRGAAVLLEPPASGKTTFAEEVPSFGRETP